MDRLDNIENVEVTIIDDTLIGNNGANIIERLAGSDLIRGGAGNDILDGGGGNHLIQPGDDGSGWPGGAYGTDIVFGGTGHDTFVYDMSYNGLSGRVSSNEGRTVVGDFAKGQDHLDVGVHIEDATPPDIYAFGFAIFDSNHDGVLTNTDDNVAVRSYTLNGSTKVSTVLQVGGAAHDSTPNVAEGTIEHTFGSGMHELVVFGVTGLHASDF